MAVSVTKKIGRPKGSLAIVTAKARGAAMLVGLLPHEWLLKVSRGEPILQKHWRIRTDKNGKELSRVLIEEQFYADFPMRVDAAKAAAPFYAPKLAVQNISMSGSPDAVADVLKQVAARLPV